MTKRAKLSAGLLMFRKTGQLYEVLLAHPGGPYGSNKDEGAWTIPKGEYEQGEEPLAAAQREFTEETGFVARGPFLELGCVQQKSGKTVLAWAFAGECDPGQVVSNTCEIEWPPRSGRRILIPEVDRAAWFTAHDAATFIREEQRSVLIRLEERLAMVDAEPSVPVDASGSFSN